MNDRKLVAIGGVQHAPSVSPARQPQAHAKAIGAHRLLRIAAFTAAVALACMPIPRAVADDPAGASPVVGQPVVNGTAPAVIINNGPGGQNPEQMRQMMEAAKRAAEAAKQHAGGGDKGDRKNEGEKKAEEKKSDDKKEGEKPAEASAIVQRPVNPETPADPNELKAALDTNDRVRFNFNGQPWPKLLDWLARISKMSLDWQELPGDYLNLVTQQSYTVPEARDIINRHLLARGFTILRRGETLTVVNIKKLDPSLVPRVEPEELSQRDPHEFCKVCFRLDWIMAETAAEELKPLLSANGKLSAMPEANRIEVMDTVINLRDIQRVLTEEQSPDNQEQLIRTFKLRFAKAAEVREQVLKLLGLDKPAGPPMPQNPDQARQQAEMMAQMQQQGGGKKGKAQPGGSQEPPVSIAVDERQNILLVRAEPDKMAVVIKAVEAIDVPNDSARSLLANLARMQVYRLNGVDPEPVVKTLQEIGQLDPATRLEVDKKNHAIVAYATLADHVTIRAVVEKLTGSERRFEVMKLRRLPADYVAGTIDFMVNGTKKEKRRNSWDWGNRDQTPENQSQFRVDADIENNRLLLWANDVELTEVENLLVKLGEIPAKGSPSETVRVIETGDPQKAAELVERLRHAWPSLAPNALQCPASSAKRDAARGTPPAAAAREKDAAAQAPKSAARSDGASVFHLAEMRLVAQPPAGQATDREDGATGGAPSTASPAADSHAADAQPVTAASADESPSPERRTADDNRSPAQRNATSPAADGHQAAPGAAPPVRLTVGPDGRLVISSEDTQALDLLQDLAEQMAPSRREYKVFHLKYAWAVNVKANLDEFFREDGEQQQRRSSWWWWDDRQQQDTNDERRLSKRKKLRFITDLDTNSILVEGAEANQLQTIEELVQLYDQPPPRDSQSVRRTEVINLRYAKAKDVAATVKDVYRDLLSENDKALQDGARNREVRYFFGDDEDASKLKTPKFKGLLSIGIDETTNSLAISAPAYLYEPVVKMVHELDQAAEPLNTVRVLQLDGDVNASYVLQTLDTVLGDGQAAKRLQDRAKNKQQDQQGNRSRNDRDRHANTDRKR